MNLYTYTKEDATFDVECILGITWMVGIVTGITGDDWHETEGKPHGSILSSEDIADGPWDLDILGTDGGNYRLEGILLPGGAKKNTLTRFTADKLVELIDA